MTNNSFTPIPDWILRDQCLSTAELYVYSYMYKGWTYARSKGYEYQISYKKLAEGLNYKTTGAVIRTINKMESLGILTVERSKRADNHDNKNIFRFNEDKVYVNQGHNLETLPNDNSEIEGLKNEELRVSRLTPHTKENKENKNNNLSTIGPGTGKDILQESEELSFNFSSSEDFSYLNGTGLTAENVERLRYWEKIINDFSKKKFIPVAICGICVIDNEDLYRMKEYIISEIENDKEACPYREHLEHHLNEVYHKMAA